MRSLAGGHFWADIDMCIRVHEVFNLFSRADSSNDDFGEGFIYSWEHRAASNSISDAHAKGIPPSQSMTALFKPLSGILNQRKYLSIRFISITIELSLVDHPLDPIVDEVLCANPPQTCQIQNVQVKCDLVSLDSGLNEFYIKLLE